MNLKMALVPALGLIVLSGCQGQEKVAAGSEQPVKPEPPPGLVAQAYPPIPDLPVPLGFHMDEQRSRNTAAGGIRVVQHLYKGRADKFELQRFYRQQMRIAGWT